PRLKSRLGTDRGSITPPSGAERVGAGHAPPVWPECEIGSGAPEPADHASGLHSPQTKSAISRRRSRRISAVDRPRRPHFVQGRETPLHSPLTKSAISRRRSRRISGALLS